MNVCVWVFLCWCVVFVDNTPQLDLSKNSSASHLKTQSGPVFLFRLLFWTDWDATFPRIEGATMSGTARHVVFKDMEMGAWPNGLTLDHLEKRIVWTDAR